MDPHDPDPQLADLLRSRRPQPSMHFVAETERELFAPRRSRLSWRPAAATRLGGALVAGFAALVLVLSLAGVGPLAGDDTGVQARDDCHTVAVKRFQRVPEVVTGKDGQAKVVYVRKRVPRYERVCR
jgi:hypothetical protein